MKFQLFFLAALICYSAFLMVELDTFDGVSSLKPYEWIVYVYTLADMLEEYRNLVGYMIKKFVFVVQNSRQCNRFHYSCLQFQRLLCLLIRYTIYTKLVIVQVLCQKYIKNRLRQESCSFIKL